VLQLHGAETPEEAAELRAAGPWRVWKAVRVRDEEDLLDAVDLYAEVVDGLLLDGWSAHAEGGTGTRFDWDDVAPHRVLLPETCELIVAGGLTSESVAHMVDVLRPDVVDVSSGVESAPGRKSASKMAAFVASARAAAGSQRPR
jgi:phosphoribosylanthranilate isomerase